jgi:hypothetical protein
MGGVRGATGTRRALPRARRPAPTARDLGDKSGPRSAADRDSQPGQRDIMHPMFVKLFIEPGSGYPLTEEDEKRRRSRRAGRHRSPTTARTSSC